MKEQPLFAPGDRVVCVDSKGTDCLIEGNEYKITAILRCNGCGVFSVCIGIIGKGTSGFVKCLRCGNRWKHSKKELGFRQTRFVPVDFDKYAEETFHQSLKGKPVNA